MPISDELGGNGEQRSAPNLSKLPDPPVISLNDVPYDSHRVGTSHSAMQFVSVLAIILPALFILLALFSYPLLIEDVGNECSAFEVSALRAAAQNIGNEKDQHSTPGVVAFGNSLQRGSNGETGSDIIKIKYPNIPAPIGCAVSYYQLLINSKNWKNFITPLIAKASDAKAHNNFVARTRLSHSNKLKQRAPAYASRNDNALSAPLNFSANDLALGFDKLRWGMSIKDAKNLWPLEETPVPPAPMLDGPLIQPMHVSATLSLDDYVYAGCTFAVKFLFEDTKLTSVELEADGSVNFKACHTQIVASLLRQYGEESGGISPVSPYHGYSVHGEWRGPITDVDYNELQNAVIEITLSSTRASP
jgi:hypothetical protein